MPRPFAVGFNISTVGGTFISSLGPWSPLYAKGDPIFRVLRYGLQILEF